jgi:predicted helicase
VRPLTDYELLPESINHLLDDLVALLDNTDTRQLRKEIAAGELERDLGVYFYEHFLEQYDAGERMNRGVYYTPPELVRYLVRATHEVLIQHFGLSRGLADSHVILLDPAAGTGTFVLGAAEQALAVEKSRGTARQASSALCETIYSQTSMDSSGYPLPTPLHI